MVGQKTSGLTNRRGDIMVQVGHNKVRDWQIETRSWTGWVDKKSEGLLPRIEGLAKGREGQNPGFIYYVSWSSGQKALDGGQRHYFSPASQNLSKSF